MLFSARSHVIIKGIGRVGGSSARPDQNTLITRLTAVLEQVGATRPFSVLAVNVFPSPASPVYDVQLDSVESVDSILISFSRFVRRQDPDARPAALDGVSMFHSVTTGTRIRLSLLRVSLF